MKEFVSRIACSSLVTLILFLGGCKDKEPTEEVVIYASLDKVFSQPILEAFEKETGIKVLDVYDSEATKTTGRTFKKGLGCKGKCAVMFKVDGLADRFRAIVAMGKSSREDAKGRFRVYNEDFFANQVLWDSGEMTKDSPAKEIDIELNDAQCLMLVFDGKDVLGNWADARVINEAESD